MFQKRSRPSRRPVRRTREYIIREGSTNHLPVQSDDWYRSNDGSLDRIITHKEDTYGCGCSRQLVKLGGHCTFGGAICELHLKLCQSCGVPCCPQHSRTVRDGDIHILECIDCRDWQAPIRGIKNAFRFLSGRS